MRHFLAPLLREGRARGHEMVGACPDGPLLAPLRAESFRLMPLPLKRSASPLAQAAGFAALVRLAAFREARPGACAYAVERLSRPDGGAGGGRAPHRLYLPWLPVQPAEPPAPPCGVPRDGMDGAGKRHRPVHDGLGGGSGVMPDAWGSPVRRSPSGMAATRRCFIPTQRRARRGAGGARRAGAIAWSW